MSNIDRLIIGLIICGGCVGIWFGFPITSIVFDEMFPGSVLRSIAEYSVLPQGTDVLYGTITYYINYVAIAPIMGILFLIYGFDIGSLTLFLTEYTWIVYLISRVISVGALIVSCLYVYKILSLIKISLYERRVALILIFSNLLVITMYHTAKVWPITFAFVLASLYYTILSVSKDLEHQKQFHSNIFKSLVLSACAMANFPLAGIFFIIVCLIIGWTIYTQKTVVTWQKLLKYIVYSLVIACIIVLSNWNGIYAQVRSIIFDYTLSPQAQAVNVSLFTSFLLNSIRYVISSLPILIVICAGLILSRGELHKKDTYFYIPILSFAAVYFVTISSIARWSVDTDSYIRYMFPMVLFTGLCIGVFNVSQQYEKYYKIIIYSIAFVSCVYALRTIYMLSVPSTYNVAQEYIMRELNDTTIAIVNHAGPALALYQGKHSYEINSALGNYTCASRCEIVRNLNIVNDRIFKGVFIENFSQKNSIQDIIKQLPKNTLIYELVFDADKASLDLEHIGSYLDMRLWSLDRLGKNIYSNHIQ